MNLLRNLFSKPRREGAPDPSEGASERTHVLHLHLGPVQGWIAEARRTRDLWAGSFLLSYLSGRAMAVVVDNDGVITSPLIDKSDPFFNAILSAHKGENAGACDVAMGSLPNHFRAKVPESFDPEDCVNAIQSTWRAIAQAVWDAFIPANCPDSVRAIWERQIGADEGAPPFWDVMWVKGPEGGADGTWLDARKFTRLPKPAYGGVGTMCAMMSGLEALSGQLGAAERDDFWNGVRGQISEYLYPEQPIRDVLELGPTERLSAIAFVKRMFPALDGETHQRLLGWAPGREGTKRKTPLRVWPSTAHVSAAPWLLNAAAATDGVDGLNDFKGKIKEQMLQVAENGSQVCKLRSETQSWSSVDARLFYAEAAKELSPDGKTSADWSQDAWTALSKLRALKNAAGEPLGRPSTYYAILAADGDHLGKALSTHGSEKILPRLNTFANTCNKIVEDHHNGVLIYAGGDDVFAFAPVDDAIALAQALRTSWGEAFSGIEDPPTLSVGLSFVDMKHVLRWGVVETQRLLNAVAKEKMGRNALAIRIQRGGAQDTLWASQWGCAVEALQALITDEVGDNTFTYKLLRKVPWIWSPAGEFLEERNRTEDLGLANADLARLIEATTECPCNVAKRLVQAAHIRKNGPLSPDLLAILRFMLLHRRPLKPETPVASSALGPAS